MKLLNNITMKKIKLYFFSVICFSILFLTSCTSEDPAPSPADPRESYVGVWGVSENWNKLSYEATISIDASSSTGIIIDNFANSGVGVKTHAVVSGNSVSIAPTPQTLSNGWVIENGSGYLQGTTKINWSYLFNDTADQISATAVYTKK
jgi:hypothetical protein